MVNFTPAEHEALARAAEPLRVSEFLRNLALKAVEKELS